MLIDERKTYIMSTLHNQSIVKTQELVTTLNASESTIRRDLQELEEAGKLQRIHGGAKLLIKLDNEPSVLEKTTKHHQDKIQVAKLASSFIQVDDIIYLDAGTATYEMIPHLPTKLTVVTNSVYHAAALIARGIKTTIIGGNIKLTTQATADLTSVRQIESLRFDKAFMGINSIHLEAGLTTPDPNEALVKATVMKQTNQCYTLADSSKFNKMSFAKVADLNESILLTNPLDPKLLSNYQMETTIKEAKE